MPLHLTSVPSKTKVGAPKKEHVHFWGGSLMQENIELNSLSIPPSHLDPHSQQPPSIGAAAAAAASTALLSKEGKETEEHKKKAALYSLHFPRRLFNGIDSQREFSYY